MLLNKKAALLVVVVLLLFVPQAFNVALIKVLRSRLDVPLAGTVRWSFWPGALRLDSLRLLRGQGGEELLRGELAIFFNPLDLLGAREVALRLEASDLRPVFLSELVPQELYQALGPLRVSGSLALSAHGMTVRKLNAQAAGASLTAAGQVAAKGVLDLRSSVTLQRPLVDALPAEVILSLFGPQPPGEGSRIIELEVEGSWDEPRVTLASELARLEVAIT